MNLSSTEMFTYSTTRIECEDRFGNKSTGTGFFFKFKEINPNSFDPVLITNKQVIKGAFKGKFTLNRANKDGQPIDEEKINFEIENFENVWISHSDNDVDLCFLPIGQILNDVKSKGENPFFIAFEKSLIPNRETIDSLFAVEDIIMIGYPNGIWDQHNNKPIIRKGITATNPRIDYNGKKEFLIDAACFPGSSGSPILINNDMMYTNKIGTYMKGRILFLGILYAGPQFTATGEIQIIDVPIVNKPISFTNIPNNLGIIIKAERIIELENIYLKM